jgi:uncharacterized repeat protein (TIGR03803 family)
MSGNKGPVSLRAVLLVITMAILGLAPGARAASKFKTLFEFKGGRNGWGPGRLVFDQAGNLYGATGLGGGPGCRDGCGLVFKLTPHSDGSWTKSTLYIFCTVRKGRLCADGNYPDSSLIFDRGGNLYGTTDEGGVNGFGTVFELMPNPDGSWSEKVLHPFTGYYDGGYPAGGVIFDQAGNLYGTTFGARGHGAVFKLSPNADGSWTEKVLHHFTGPPDGGEPEGGLIFDQAGNLYGTTLWGGNSSNCIGFPGCGVVFKLTPRASGRWGEKVLHSFTGGDGAFPTASLIFDQAGNLYGTASEGGNFSQCDGGGCGVVFQLAPNADRSWKEKVIHRFTGGSGGAYPAGTLIFDPAGNLYGSTEWGGNLSYCMVSGEPGGCGVVFKMIPNPNGGWNETVLHRFVDSEGGHPGHGVTFDGAGNLYGTTEGDGFTTFGLVFEITP